LLHQLVVDMQPPGRIENHHIPRSLAVLDGIAANGHRILVRAGSE
jgi:hypothetical protein